MTQTVVLQYTAEPNVPVIIAEIYNLVAEALIEDLYSQWDALMTTYEITVDLDNSVAGATILLIEDLENAETGTLVADKQEMEGDGADTITITWVPDDVLWTDIDVEVNGNAVTIAVGDPLVVDSEATGTVTVQPTGAGARYARPLFLEVINIPT